MLALVPMTEAAYAAFLTRAIDDYADSNVEAGFWTRAEALEKSSADFRKLLPEGLATPRHYLRTIVRDADAQRVGEVWFAVKADSAKRAGFIYELFVEEKFRRLGYAHQAMQLVEAEARKLNLAELELHVFGYNHPARGLYEKLGYQVASLNLIKKL